MGNSFYRGSLKYFPLSSSLKWASSMPRFFNDFWMWLSRCLAGPCRTYPWPAVPDWPWCRNADAGWKKLTTGLTFLRHSDIYIWIFQHHTALITPAAAVYGRAGYITFHYLQLAVWACGVYFFINAGMSDCPASNQSGTGKTKNADAGISPVPE